jgi:CubicO group peptidase (beta-lactamase class C family)
VTSPSELDPELRLELEQLLAAARVPGASIAMTTAAARRHCFALGSATLEPRRAMSADSWLHLFSGTKLYTATAVLKLAQQAKLALDAPVRTYLPELPLRADVTVRHLLAHDSGLPDTLRAFLAIHPADGTSVSTADALRRYRLDHGRPPGRGAHYANVNYAVLGELISRRAEMPYAAFVESAVLAPLGAELKFAQTHDVVARAATGYAARWSLMRLALPLLLPQASPWIFGAPHGSLIALRPYDLDTAAAGGLVGRAESFLPLLEEMLRADDGLLSAASKREMLSVQARGAAGIVARAGVGLGWKRGLIDGLEFWNHEGGGAGFCSETRLYPQAGLGLVLLLNRSQSPALSRLCHRICERLRAQRQASTVTTQLAETPVRS